MRTSMCAETSVEKDQKRAKLEKICDPKIYEAWDNLNAFRTPETDTKIGYEDL